MKNTEGIHFIVAFKNELNIPYEISYFQIVDNQVIIFLNLKFSLKTRESI
jgi:hypothetical protein